MKKPLNFEEYLASKVKLIDKTLHKLMPPGTARPAALHSAMRYAVFTRGKRIRPVVCMAVCSACGGNEDDVLLPAASLELFHSYTLIHDDLPCMDNDVIRRGKPSVFVVYGEANALLAGDALQALAFETISRSLPPPGYSPNQFVIELARVAGSKGVVGGQVEDLIAQNKKKISRTDMEFIHKHKTAHLFRTASRIGAITAGARKNILRAMDRYGYSLGMVFQLTDDILDSRDPNQTRKSFNYTTINGKQKTIKEITFFAQKARESVSILGKNNSYLLISAVDMIVNRNV